MVGLGMTGLATARFLANRHARVTVADSSSEADVIRRAKALQSEGVDIALGPHSPELFETADGIVVSPGVPLDMKMLTLARERGVPITGEIELAARFVDAPIVAITGTNGKTTTTQLTGEILAHSGLNVFVGGNIGNPLIGYVDGDQQADVVVVEVSSFQLDTVQAFHPRVGVLLNVSDDHLDRYADFEAYQRSKQRVFANLSGDDVAVYSGDDQQVNKMGSRCSCRRLPFSETGKAPAEASGGAVIQPHGITLNMAEVGSVVVDTALFKMKGPHNRANLAAAALAALVVGGTLSGLEHTVANFEGPAHRLAYVTTINGVDYYDDSKGTNTDAVIKALASFDAPVVLILGGRSKDTDFRDLADSIRKSVKHLVAMGETAGLILRQLGQVVEISTADSMAEAVRKAGARAVAGDVVLLSRVAEIEIPGLDRESSMHLLEELNVPEERRALVYEATKGHPLSMELLHHADEGALAKGKSLSLFFYEEVLSALSQEELAAIHQLCVLRTPIPWDALHGVNEYTQ